MPVKSKLYDPRTGNVAKIGDEGELNFVQHPHPPKNEEIFPLPFSQFFTDNGTSTGSNDMRVDGSTNNVEFSIEASEEYDIYIKSITVQISDNGARLNLFGAIAALTNGVQFYYKEQKIDNLIISEAIKTNLDFMRDATSGKDFGDSSSAWRADTSGSGFDTYFPEWDLTERFGMQWGLRLVKGTTDKLVFNVRDNITAIDVFNIKGYGIIV